MFRQLTKQVASAEIVILCQFVVEYNYNFSLFKAGFFNLCSAEPRGSAYYSIIDLEKNQHYNYLKQGSQTLGPLAAYGPPDSFVRPATISKTNKSIKFDIISLF